MNWLILLTGIKDLFVDSFKFYALLLLSLPLCIAVGGSIFCLITGVGVDFIKQKKDYIKEKEGLQKAVQIEQARLNGLRKGYEKAKYIEYHKGYDKAYTDHLSQIEFYNAFQSKVFSNVFTKIPTVNENEWFDVFGHTVKISIVYRYGNKQILQAFKFKDGEPSFSDRSINFASIDRNVICGGIFKRDGKNYERLAPFLGRYNTTDSTYECGEDTEYIETEIHYFHEKELFIYAKTEKGEEFVRRLKISEQNTQLD